MLLKDLVCITVSEAPKYKPYEDFEALNNVPMNGLVTISYRGLIFKIYLTSDNAGIGIKRYSVTLYEVISGNVVGAGTFNYISDSPIDTVQNIKQSILKAIINYCQKETDFYK